MTGTPAPPDRVPAIDLSPFLDGSADDRHAVVAAFRQACEQIGFVVISGHGLPAGVLERGFAESRAFFDLPQPVKDRSTPKLAGKQRGYHAFATRGLAKTLGQETPPDLRESLFVGPVEDQRAHYAALPEAADAYAPNILPDQPPGLDETLVALYRGFERLSADLFRVFALALDMPEDWFADKVDRHFSIMSCHHYPALTEMPQPGQLRTGAHTDYGAMTILAMTEAIGGLEACLPNGNWVPVNARRDELVINLGDMMARWTNDRWKSTLHRVVNPPVISLAASRRQSIGYFMHPNYDAPIACIPTCRTVGQGPRYPAITAGRHIRAKIEQSHKAA